MTARLQQRARSRADPRPALVFAVDVDARLTGATRNCRRPAAALRVRREPAECRRLRVVRPVPPPGSAIAANDRHRRSDARDEPALIHGRRAAAAPGRCAADTCSAWRERDLRPGRRRRDGTLGQRRTPQPVLRMDAGESARPMPTAISHRVIQPRPVYRSTLLSYATTSTVQDRRLPCQCTRRRGAGHRSIEAPPARRTFCLVPQCASCGRTRDGTTIRVPRKAQRRDSPPARVPA
jgi:hypothetical protein